MTSYPDHTSRQFLLPGGDPLNPEQALPKFAEILRTHDRRAIAGLVSRIISGTEANLKILLLNAVGMELNAAQNLQESLAEADRTALQRIIEDLRVLHRILIDASLEIFDVPRQSLLGDHLNSPLS